MCGIIAAIEILVADPFGLPDVEGALSIVVNRFLWVGGLDAEWVFVAEPSLPGFHEGGHAFDLWFIRRVVGEVVCFVRVRF